MRFSVNIVTNQLPEVKVAQFCIGDKRNNSYSTILSGRFSIRLFIKLLKDGVIVVFLKRFK